MTERSGWIGLSRLNLRLGELGAARRYAQASIEPLRRAEHILSSSPFAADQQLLRRLRIPE